MPRVPEYRSPVAQTQALPSPRFSTDTRFGDLGQASARPLQAVSELASGIQKIATEEKRNADDVATTDAFAKTVELRNQLFWDPQNGAMARKGKDAFGVVDEFEEKFKAGADEIEASLHNEDQRALYRKIRIREGSELNTTLQKHLFTEAKAFDEQTIKSGVETARNDAVLNYMDPGRIERNIEMQRTLLLSFAERNGIDPNSDAAKVMLQEATSKTHMAVVSRMLTNDQDLLAQDYFKKNRDSFATSDLVAMEKVVEEGSLRGESQRQTDALMKKGLTMTQALEEAKKIEEPRVRDAVSDRLKTEYAARKNAEDLDREKRFQEIANVAEQSQSRDQVPLDQWLSLSLSERNAIDGRIKQLRQGIEPATDWSEYYNLKTLASVPETQGDFLKTNLFLYRTKMADAEFKELVSLQTSIRNKDGKADSELNGFRTHSQIVNDTLNEIDIDPSPKPGTSQAEQVNLFRRKVDEQILLHQDRTGRKATTEEVQGIVDRLATRVITDRGFFWDTKKRAFEVPAGEFEIDPDDIPRAERLKIEDALRRNKRPVNDQNILKLYTLKLQGVLNRAD